MCNCIFTVPLSDNLTCECESLVSGVVNQSRGIQSCLWVFVKLTLSGNVQYGYRNTFFSIPNVPKESISIVSTGKLKGWLCHRSDFPILLPFKSWNKETCQWKFSVQSVMSHVFSRLHSYMYKYDSEALSVSLLNGVKVERQSFFA